MAEAIKLGPGTSLQEMVRGSLNYTLRTIERAWRSQFRSEIENEDWSLWVEEVFDGYVIVYSGKLPPSSFYHVTYTRDGESYVFADRDQWTTVELTYTPRSIQEQILSADESPRFVESVGRVQMALDEAAAKANTDGPWPIRGIGITAGVVNENGRRYKPAVLAQAVNAARRHLHESLGQGRARQLYGESEHPNMKATRRPFLTEVCVNWTDINFDGRQILLEGQLLGTQLGKDIRAQMLGGVIPGVSQRAYGESVMVEEGDVTIEEVTRLVITGYDLTVEPSDPEAGVTYFESKTQHKEGKMPGKKDNDNDGSGPIAEGQQGALDLATLQVQHPELVEAVIRHNKEQERLAEEERQRQEREEAAERQRIIDEANARLRQQLGLSETDDLERVLAEREEERQRLAREKQIQEVQAFVESEVNAIANYPGWVKKDLVEAVKAQNPATKEEALAAIKGRRAFTDEMLAQLKRNAMGDPMAMQVIGPVIEGVTGHPAYAEPAMLLVESMVRRGLQPDLSGEKAPVNEINLRFAREYLEAYDKAYKHHLMAEARLFQEAEQASDLSLPYSVMRAVVAEALPQLVATTVFDVGTTDQADFRVYYESYEGETGETVTLTVGVDHINVASDEGAWVQLTTDGGLDVKRIVPGSYSVQPNGGGAPYTEGDDYVIDPANGLLYTVPAADGGTIGDTTALDIGLQYRAIRKGELQAVERAKVGLDYVLLSMEADRLATDISREAIVLSRAALGYDATARTISALVNRVRRYIDSALIGLALSASLSVVGNAGLTWNSGAETLDDLVEKLGLAKVKIINRFYEPTAILMSATNAEIASNWDNFSAAGSRPDALLNANGFVGRLKGLPLVQTTEMVDTYDLVVNREIVHHRVLQPMQLLGPYASHSSNKLVPSDQYYVEEFNGQASPVKTKAAHVKHA